MKKTKKAPKQPKTPVPTSEPARASRPPALVRSDWSALAAMAVVTLIVASFLVSMLYPLFAAP